MEYIYALYMICKVIYKVSNVMHKIISIYMIARYLYLLIYITGHQAPSYAMHALVYTFMTNIIELSRPINASCKTTYVQKLIQLHTII